MSDEMGYRLQSRTSGVGVRHVESLKMNVTWKLHTFPSLIVGFWIFFGKIEISMSNKSKNKQYKQWKSH